MRIQVIDDVKGEVASVPVDRFGTNGTSRDWLVRIIKAIGNETDDNEIRESYIRHKTSLITVAPLTSLAAPSDPQFKFEVGQRVSSKTYGGSMEVFERFWDEGHPEMYRCGYIPHAATMFPASDLIPAQEPQP